MLSDVFVHAHIMCGKKSCNLFAGELTWGESLSLKSVCPYICLLTFHMFIFYNGILLPPTCKINYVNMQHNYVNMRLIYVDMQHNYVDMQYQFLSKNFFYCNK